MGFLARSSETLASEFSTATQEEIRDFLVYAGQAYEHHSNLVKSYVRSSPEVRAEVQGLADLAEELRKSIVRLSPGAMGMLSLSSITAVEMTGLLQDIAIDEPVSNLMAHLFRLEKLANEATQAHKDLVSSRGKITLGERLHGKSKDILADDCSVFVREHGGSGQAVVLRMVQAVMWSVDGKGVEFKGRKSVRRVAQNS